MPGLAAQFEREAWWVVPVLRCTMVGKKADGFTKGDVEKKGIGTQD